MMKAHVSFVLWTVISFTSGLPQLYFGSNHRQAQKEVNPFELFESQRSVNDELEQIVEDLVKTMQSIYLEDSDLTNEGLQIQELKGNGQIGQNQFEPEDQVEQLSQIFEEIGEFVQQIETAAQTQFKNSIETGQISSNGQSQFHFQEPFEDEGQIVEEIGQFVDEDQIQYQQPKIIECMSPSQLSQFEVPIEDEGQIIEEIGHFVDGGQTQSQITSEIEQMGQSQFALDEPIETQGQISEEIGEHFNENIQSQKPIDSELMGQSQFQFEEPVEDERQIIGEIGQFVDGGQIQSQITTEIEQMGQSQFALDEPNETQGQISEEIGELVNENQIQSQKVMDVDQYQFQFGEPIEDEGQVIEEVGQFVQNSETEDQREMYKEIEHLGQETENSGQDNEEEIFISVSQLQPGEKLEDLGKAPRIERHGDPSENPGQKHDEISQAHKNPDYLEQFKDNEIDNTIFNQLEDLLQLTKELESLEQTKNNKENIKLEKEMQIESKKFEESSPGKIGSKFGQSLESPVEEYFEQKKIFHLGEQENEDRRYQGNLKSTGFSEVMLQDEVPRPVEESFTTKHVSQNFQGSMNKEERYKQIQGFLDELEKEISHSQGQNTMHYSLSESTRTHQLKGSGGTHSTTPKTHSSGNNSGDKTFWQKVSDTIGSSYNTAKEKAKEIYTNVKDKVNV